MTRGTCRNNSHQLYQQFVRRWFLCKALFQLLNEEPLLRHVQNKFGRKVTGWQPGKPKVFFAFTTAAEDGDK
jgi:hypothetical protein